MTHKKQIITIILVSTILGLIRFLFIQDQNFTLIKKKKIVEQLTSFIIPENLSEPMAISLEFAKFLYDEKSAKFIDARDIEDYNAGHMKNAIHIAYDYYEDYEDIINSLDPTSLYIIYCNGTECSLSLDLAEYLYNELLFEKILIFEGGWPEWRDAKYPSLIL